MTIAAGSGLDAKNQPISIAADQDNAGGEGFAQADGTTIQTTSNALNAVQIVVNTGAATAGTGDAKIAAIMAGTTAGKVTIDARGGSVLDIQDETSGPVTNITAAAVDLQATKAIGTIDTLQQLTGNAIETQVGSIVKAATTAAGSTIHLAQTGSLTISPATNIGIAGVEQGSAIIRATQNIDAGTANSIDLWGNDNLALVAGGKVTVPTAGFNTAVTGKPAGDLIMSGNDVVAFGGSRTMNFAANHLFFSSKAPGGDPLGSDVLNTDLNKITVIFGNGTDIRNLTIHEDQGAFPAAIDELGLRGLNINVLKGDLTLKSGGTITDDDIDPMDLTKTIDVHARNITLDVTGSALSSPRIAPAAAEGKIDLRADANLTIKGSGVVLEVSSGNDVTGIAGGTAKIEPGAFIRSFDPTQPANPGVAGQLPGDPNFAINIVTPQVTAAGKAEFQITFGQADERNYALTIDWGDGTVETFTALEGGTLHIFSHNYSPDNLPDPGNPAAPIPMAFTLINDPNINFFDSTPQTIVQFGSTTSGSTSNFTVARSGDDLSILSGVALAGVPGEGLAVKRIDTTPKVAALGIPRGNSADTLISTRQVLGESTLASDVRAAVADLVTAEEDAVILEVLSPDEEVVDRIPLRLDVLKDLDAFYRRLPDGKYRLLLRRDGREIPIFREVLTIRGGRVIDPNRVDETQDKPPGGKEPAKAKAGAEKTSLNLSPEEIERLWQRLLAEQALAVGAAVPATGTEGDVELIDPIAADGPSRGTRGPRVQDLAREPRAPRGAVDKTAAAGESEQNGESADALKVSGQPLAAAAVVLGVAAANSRESPGQLVKTVDGAAGLVARLWRRIRAWLRKP